MVMEDIKKMELPALSETIRNRNYQSSGRCPFKAYVYMFLGLLLSPIITIIAITAFSFALVVPELTFIFFMFISIKGAILVFIGLIILSILAPISIGVPIGFIEAVIGRAGKCRNEKISTVFGFLAGALGGLFLFVIVMIGNAIEGSVSDNVSVISITLIGIVFGVGGAIGGYWGIKEQAFCEKCGLWYDKWGKEINYSARIAEPLAAALNKKGELSFSDAVEAIENIRLTDRLPENQYPSITLRTRKCPNCSDADVQWHATANWGKGESELFIMRFMAGAMLIPLRAISTIFGQDKNIVPAVAKISVFRFLSSFFETKQKYSSEWFTLMLPASFSRKLEDQLFS
jgi:hypothetical protein